MNLSFSRIGITGKPAAAAVQDVIGVLVTLLTARGVSVAIDADLVPAKGAASVAPNQLAEVSDLIICVGGDGTLLHAARRFGISQRPLVGVNLGRLGFLVDVSPADLEVRMDQILSGDYVEETRSLLSMRAERKGESLGEGIALNDVVLHKSEPGRLLEFSTHIDNKGVTTHRADGIVVATPTGSTAYALSAGGPILHPTLDAIALVPICPHTLSDRPVVVGADSRIVLTVGDGTGGASVSCDGRTGLDLRAGDTVTVARLDRHVRLLHPSDYDFFRILRDKLHWGRSPDA